MLKTTFLATTALLLACASARSELVTAADRDRRFVNDQIVKGEHELVRMRRLTTDAGKLYSLDLSITALRNAQTTADRAGFDELRADANRDLVRALDAESEIYFNRKSLSLAQSTANDALAIDPNDSRALNLVQMIKGASYDDIVYTQPNSIAAQRIYARRTAARGASLRGSGGGGLGRY